MEGGLLKRTTCNRWVHSACTLWVPETAVDMDRGLVDGLQYIPKVCTPAELLYYQSDRNRILCQMQVLTLCGGARARAIMLSSPTTGPALQLQSVYLG